VLVVTKHLEPSLQQLVDEQEIHLLADTFDEAQLDNVFLVIAATDDATSTVVSLTPQMPAIVL
jgi:uroporphyrin-III C-methyltransferase/precorrin-2 dehydrogenase/sirohydrochlorin ferrochelatase